MALKLDKGPCNSSLQKFCIVIACFDLFLNVFIFFGKSIGQLIIVTLYILANGAVLRGALINNEWLVLCRLMLQIPYFLFWPITFFGILFNVGDCCSKFSPGIIFWTCIFLIVHLIYNIYFTLIMWSFHEEVAKGSIPNSSAPIV